MMIIGLCSDITWNMLSVCSSSVLMDESDFLLGTKKVIMKDIGLVSTKDPLILLLVNLS